MRAKIKVEIELEADFERLPIVKGNEARVLSSIKRELDRHLNSMQFAVEPMHCEVVSRGKVYRDEEDWPLFARPSRIKIKASVSDRELLRAEK
jgi:hypothetical protein